MKQPRAKLVDEIHTLLDLPLEGRKGRKTKAKKIVNAVIQALTNKIREGKPVIIQDLGTFYTHEFKARKHKNVIVYSETKGKNKKLNKIVLSPVVTTKPAFKAIKFKLAPRIEAALNLDTPITHRTRPFIIERTPDGI